MPVDITGDMIVKAVGDLIESVIPGLQLAQSQVNRVASFVGDFAMITPLGRIRLSTNLDTYSAASGTKSYAVPTQFRLQLDVYGPNSADNVQVITSVFRDAVACDLMPTNIQPLFSEDPAQMAFMDGEQQYEDRWMTYLNVQADPSISTTQDFAGILTPGLISVDAAYPPGGAQ